MISFALESPGFESHTDILSLFSRASTNFQNQEVQDFQTSKFGSEANET